MCTNICNIFANKVVYQFMPNIFANICVHKLPRVTDCLSVHAKLGHCCMLRTSMITHLTDPAHIFAPRMSHNGTPTS